MNKALLNMMAIVLLLVLGTPGLAQNSDPTKELQQLLSKFQSDQNDQQLRESILKLVATMNPRPAVPDECRRHMVRGEAAFKSATPDSGYSDAVTEFRQAADAAPWFGDAYYN
ncbi:MAG TPA: hypothetical protein VGI80_01070, partial [Pyrinomonadaceae bacterium]